MRGDDLRIAVVGVVFIAAGIVLFLLDVYLSEHLAEPICDIYPFGFGALVVAGIGMLYVAFSKRFRTEP